jgi:Predicted membrane protein
VGTEKALALGFDPWVAVIMGTITGSVGGMLRDVLINEIPLIFRKEIYALACVIGCVVFTVLRSFEANKIFTELTTAIVVILIRTLAVRFQWYLPILKGEENNS